MLTFRRAKPEVVPPLRRASHALMNRLLRDFRDLINAPGFPSCAGWAVDEPSPGEKVAFAEQMTDEGETFRFYVTWSINGCFSLISLAYARQLPPREAKSLPRSSAPPHQALSVGGIQVRQNKNVGRNARGGFARHFRIPQAGKTGDCPGRARLSPGGPGERRMKSWP